MRSLLHVLVISLFLIPSSASAQEPIRSDAQNDGFAGPIESVFTTATASGIKWQQPGGPTLVTPIWCRDCEYDPDGAKTTSGQVVDGNFYGDSIRLVRDANGHVTDRFITNASTGQKVSHEVLGPFGKIEKTIYVEGKLRWRQTFTYDQYGHMTEWISLDAAGRQESRYLADTDKDGTIKSKSVRGKNGELQWQQTFDAETQVENFTTFDPLGRVNVTWTVARGKLTLFWEAEDSPSQFGHNFNEDVGNGDVENYDCHSDGKCDVSRVHYEFLDPKKRNPISAEWRDSQGNLLHAAYYEYVVDSFRNWTSRQVWVWTPELGERTLLETDSRTITYWQK